MGSRSAIICAVIGIIWATTGGTVSKAVASDIIDEWANVKTPAAPEIKAVTVDPKTTALMMGDLVNQVCGKRPSRGYEPEMVTLSQRSGSSAVIRTRGYQLSIGIRQRSSLRILGFVGRRGQ